MPMSLRVCSPCFYLIVKFWLHAHSYESISIEYQHCEDGMLKKCSLISFEVGEVVN